MKRIKGVKRTLMALVLLPPAWLLCTQSGLRAAAAVAQHFTGGHMTIGTVEGRIAGTIVVHDFAWRTPGVDVEVDRAEIELSLLRLLIARVQAEWLEVEIGRAHV